MDIGTALTAITAISTGIGGFASGRLSGRSSASQIAADTVDMLQAQIETLKEDKEDKDSELINLRSRVEVLEGLVTQRAEVDELGIKVILVKDIVERIATKIGA